MSGRKRMLELSYSGPSTKRFKPAVKATFPTVVKAAYPTRPRMGPGAPNSLYNARMRGVELKFKDLSSSYTTTTAGQITLINGVAQGTDYNQRVGRESVMKSLYSRMTFADATQINMVRLLYVYDKQCNGVLPAITDILANASVYAPMNLNNKDRFQTISDKVMVTSPNGPEVVFRKKYKKLNCITTYSGTDATIASIATGAIYEIFIPVANIPTNAFVTYTRMRFADQ